MLVALFAGCGGGGDETQSTIQSSSEAQSEQIASPKSEAQSSKVTKPVRQSADQKHSGKDQGSKANAAPLEVSGGGSKQFEVKGGDNSVQQYGSEAGESELREAAEAVHSFYVARIAGEWERACTYLSKATIEGLKQLVAEDPQLEGSGCAQILAALTKPLSPTLQRQATTVNAAALRQEGTQGFLVYSGAPHQTVYSMPLSLEGGAWKLGALMASALPGA